MGSNNSIAIRRLAARRTRVLIADPYPVILHGLRKMIEVDGRFEVVAEASTMQEFWKAVAAEQPEVALVDWSIASQDPEITTELLEPDLDPAIIFFTVSESGGEEHGMRQLGAQTVLSKGCSSEEILTAISKACKPPVIPDSSAKSVTLNTFLSPSAQQPAQRISQLTKREMQLIPLVCSGMKNKEIAIRLGIAESTVWHHLTSVFTKLGVEDRLGLAAFAYRNKLVPAHVEPLQVNTVQPV